MKVCARTVATLAIALSVTPISSLFAQADGGQDASSSVATQGVAAPMSTGAPTYRMKSYPKVELFLGYSRFGDGIDASSVNTNNRIVDLNGGSASLAYNFTRYLGIVGDFGGYADNKLHLTGNGSNLPLDVNSSGKAYTYLFGPRLSFRNATRLTPFAQILAGGVHASPVTVDGCSDPSCTPLPSQNSFAFTAGGGLDISLSKHFALRPIQAEYMMTRFNGVPSGSSSTQNDLRLSSGLLFRFGGAAPLPVQLACSIQPESIYAGDPITVTAIPTNLNPKHQATYHWNSTGGTVSGTGTTAQVATTGIAPGTYTVSGSVSQGRHATDQASCTSSFTVKTPQPPTISCSADPSSIAPGDNSTITAQGVSPQNHPLTYSFATTSGTLSNTNNAATLSTTGVAPGPITVMCNVVDDLGKSASATTTVNVVAPPPPPVVAPSVKNLCSLSFERDKKRPVRVDNEAKACLDEIALQMQHEPTGHLVIVGNHAEGEKPATASERAINADNYLVNEKGIDGSRIELLTSTASDGRSAADVFVPEGATFSTDGTAPVNVSLEHHRSARKHRRAARQ